VANLSDAQADILDDVSKFYLEYVIGFGCEIPDQIRELYRERAAVERDYAARLLALAQKAVDKKNKKMPLAVVGDDPAKAWNAETLIQR
jgi:hypothetical protein